MAKMLKCLCCFAATVLLPESYTNAAYITEALNRQALTFEAQAPKISKRGNLLPIRPLSIRKICDAIGASVSCAVQTSTAIACVKVNSKLRTNMSGALINF